MGLGQLIIERDEAALSPSLSERVYPLVVRSAHGVEVEAVDGTRYLDFMAGIAVCTTGHCHPRIVDAITRQAKEFIHVAGSDVYYEVQVELAERLQVIGGFGTDGRVFLANSGTEAVEAAIKLARYYRQRPGIVSFVGDFHGRSLGALSATASRGVQRAGFFVGNAPTFHGLYPNSRPIASQPPVSLDYAMDYLREVVFGRLISPDEVAAILVEPIQGEGGFIFPPAAFLPELRRLCDLYGILLIVDEVQTGIGRSGRWFAVDHVGVRPDILVVAKGLASGLPIGAIVANRSVMSWPPGAQANTFGGNPIACAAAIETLRVVEDERLIDNAVARGRELVDGLKALDAVNPDTIVEPRGLGLLVAFDVMGESPNDAESRRNALVRQAYERGLLVLPAGRVGVRLTPPLVISRDHVQQALSILDGAVSDIGRSDLVGPIATVN